MYTKQVTVSEPLVYRKSKNISITRPWGKFPFITSTKSKLTSGAERKEGRKGHTKLLRFDTKSDIS